MKRTLALLIVLAAVASWAADEISVSTTLTVENGNYRKSRRITGLKRDQGRQSADSGIVTSVVNSTNAIPISNVSTGGYTFLRNLGTNDIIVNLAVELKGGDVALLPVNSTNITHYSQGGSANLEYWVNEE